jgi:hypothetical protein
MVNQISDEGYLSQATIGSRGTCLPEPTRTSRSSRELETKVPTEVSEVDLGTCSNL